MYITNILSSLFFRRMIAVSLKENEQKKILCEILTRVDADTGGKGSAPGKVELPLVRSLH